MGSDWEALSMNKRQLILTYVSALLFLLSFFFVPWRVADPMGGHYEFSPYWQPILYDEGGFLCPVLLYLEWVIYAGGYAAFYFCLRQKREPKS
jgi:hypothetical protein